jgi:RNA polymerase-binding transcription factor DksA
MINLPQQKERLEIEEKMLVEELSKIGLYDQETGTWNATHADMPNDPISDDDTQADIFEEIEENSATGEILGERLVDVRDALAKIENGTYGICEKSGVPIEEDRLTANPAARTCKKMMNE